MKEIRVNIYFFDTFSHAGAMEEILPPRLSLPLSQADSVCRGTATTSVFEEFLGLGHIGCGVYFPRDYKSCGRPDR